jgi:hypothetical protein
MREEKPEDVGKIAAQGVNRRRVLMHLKRKYVCLLAYAALWICSMAPIDAWRQRV